MPAKKWSSVQTRITALVLAVALLAVFGLVMSRSSETRRIDTYLTADAQEHAGMLDRTLELEGSSLATFAKDYTNWSEMVQFVQTGDPAWAAVNIDEAIGTYQASAAWVFDAAGAPVHAVRDSSLGALREPMPPALSVKDVFGDSHFCHFFIAGPDGPVEIRGATIHPSDDPERETPVQGYFLVARLWNGQYLAELSRLTGKTMRIESAHGRTKPSTEITRQSGKITFIRPLPGPRGIAELTLTASLRPGWTAVAMNSGRGLLILQIALALLEVLGLTLVLWLWVTRPLNRIRRSLESGSTEALKPLEHNRTEFGQLAQLVGQFFGQNAALVKEVTERKQAEAELADQAERTRVLFEHAPDAYYLCDFHGTFLDGNRAAEELLGYPREELVGASFLKLNVLPAPELAKAAGLLVRNALGQATGPDEFVLRRKDGTSVTVEIYTHVVTIHGRKVVLGSARDITERKRTEATLHESEERFRELFESMSSGVAVYETRDRGASFSFRSLNRGGERIDSLRREEVVGRDVQQVFPGIEEFGLLAVLRRVWQTGNPERHPVGQYKDDRISGWRENYVYKLPSEEVVAVYDDVTARVQAEVALRESEERYRDLFENATDLIQSVGPDGRYIFTNRHWRETLGYSEDEVARLTMLDVLAPECHDHCRQLFGELTHGGHVECADATFIAKDGRRVFVEGNLSCGLKDGKPVATRGFFRDITKRREAEATLRTVRERREQLENIVSRSPAVAFLWRTDERLTVDFVSSNVGQLGYEPEEFLSGRLRYADIVHYEDRDHAIAEAARHVAAGASEFVQEYRVLTKPGGMRWVEDHTWVPRDSDGRITHHQGIIVDITERKQAEAALAESELKYRRVFEGSNDAMMLFSSGKFLDCNAATLRVFGYSVRDEFLDKHPGEVSPPYQADGRESRLAADENIAAAFRDGRSFFEWLHQRADGAVFPADVLLTPLDYRGRRVLQATVRDITPRKIAEAEIAQKNVELAKLNALKNQFLGMAAHDLRNPLTVVNTASSFLLDDASRLLSAEQKHDFIRRINANGEFMLKLINDLLDVAKIESGRLDLELAVGDLCALIKENLTMNRMLAEKKSIRLDFTPERGLPPLRFDRGKIEQVLNNLISNALKFSAPGTAVKVQASRVNGSVVVSVRDQGQGIPAEELDKLFQPFGKTTVRSTAGERSTGLGLAICRKIVEGHHGRIWAESEVGKGSTFSFSLPVASDEFQASDLRSQPEKT